MKREWLQRALLIPLVTLSLLSSAELLFLNAVLLPTMQRILAAAYRGEAHPFVNFVFRQIATDAYKTPLWMYQDKLTDAYQAWKTPALIVMIGTTVLAWLSTRPRGARLAIRDWPQRMAYSLFWCLLLPLFAHAHLGTYIRFMADDYCSAAVANAKGVIGATIHWYLTWTGRYSASFLDSLAGTVGPRFAPFSTSIVLISWFAVTTLALSQFPLARRKLTRICLSALLSAALVFSTLRLSFHLAQSLYWGQGMRSVLPPLVLGTACVGILRHRLADAQPSRYGWVWGLIASGLAFVAGGFNETYAVLQTSALALLLLAGVVSDAAEFKRKLLPQAAPFLLGSLAALTVLVAAPGNSVRLAVASPAPSLEATVEIAWVSMFAFLKWSFASWQRGLTLLALLLLSALISGGFFGTYVRFMESTQQNRRVAVQLPVETLVLLYSCFVPAAYALGGPPPERNQIIPAFVLVCATAFWGAIIGQLAHRERRRSKGIQPGSLCVPAAVCVVILYLLTTTEATYTQLRRLPTFARYASIWDANDLRIRSAQAEGVDHVMIAPLPQNPADLSEISRDSGNWVNECASDYYGIAVSADAAWSE